MYFFITSLVARASSFSMTLANVYIYILNNQCIIHIMCVCVCVCVCVSFVGGRKYFMHRRYCIPVCRTVLTSLSLAFRCSRGTIAKHYFARAATAF